MTREELLKKLEVRIQRVLADHGVSASVVALGEGLRGWSAAGSFTGGFPAGGFNRTVPSPAVELELDDTEAPMEDWTSPSLSWTHPHSQDAAKQEAAKHDDVAATDSPRALFGLQGSAGDAAAPGEAVKSESMSEEVLGALRTTISEFISEHEVEFAELFADSQDPKSLN